MLKLQNPHVELDAFCHLVVNLADVVDALLQIVELNNITITCPMLVDELKPRQLASIININ